MVPNVGTLTKSELLSRYYELLCKKFFQRVQTSQVRWVTKLQRKPTFSILSNRVKHPTLSRISIEKTFGPF
ncbi:hypothetical protein LSS_06519 [Leptospira santarosai serovar Shermani str. LT 821]|uniref:Uncharacterized protein n=1 Tax=Leptospira santarosai serovar Shermani str. LT 821 TaxID=758847 RepID=K8Y1I7_9LEPT|nr:hypothetical protein LSS_06519 [Leptospira santarosai serovar Shermani str. LT 821]EPG84295.1 hypothetical protein LEP1GSC048_0440 [Leptospira santarosai serovar Shermani str. 1342KT]